MKATIITILVLVVIAGGAYFFINHNKSNNTTMNQTQDTTGNQTPTTPPATPPATPPTTPDTTKVSDHPVATIDTNLGSFQVTLDHTAAPLTVENFVKLANSGFYNDLKFHRVLSGFVIQGGDPNTKSGDPSTWGQGGPGYTVPAEIGLKANVGAIGMASTQAKGPSSGSQFFIVTTESANNHAALDGNYTFFGYVTSGMDVVTKISNVPVEPNLSGEASLPVNPVIINTITIKE